MHFLAAEKHPGLFGEHYAGRGDLDSSAPAFLSNVAPAIALIISSRRLGPLFIP